MTKPVWDAEDKARRLALWGEGLNAIETETMQWVRIQADELKRLQGIERDRQKTERLARKA